MVGNTPRLLQMQGSTRQRHGLTASIPQYLLKYCGWRVWSSKYSVVFLGSISLFALTGLCQSRVFSIRVMSRKLDGWIVLYCLMYIRAEVESGRLIYLETI